MCAIALLCSFDFPAQGQVHLSKTESSCCFFFRVIAHYLSIAIYLLWYFCCQCCCCCCWTHSKLVSIDSAINTVYSICMDSYDERNTVVALEQTVYLLFLSCVNKAYVWKLNHSVYGQKSEEKCKQLKSKRKLNPVHTTARKNWVILQFETHKSVM